VKVIFFLLAMTAVPAFAKYEKATVNPILGDVSQHVILNLFKERAKQLAHSKKCLIC
jgi:hypothetical protein